MSIRSGQTMKKSKDWIFLKFCFKFIEVSQIQFRESFDSDKQSFITKVC